jgi:hypothetical protein
VLSEEAEEPESSPCSLPASSPSSVDELLELADGQLRDATSSSNASGGDATFFRTSRLVLSAVLFDAADDVDGPVVLGEEGAGAFLGGVREAAGDVEDDVDPLDAGGGRDLGAHLLEADDLAVRLGHGRGFLLGQGPGGGLSVVACSCRPRPGM